MSHFKERKEKNCLNCNAEVLGRFCQVCGQENIEPKESFWHLVTHFFYDITHFDGKFFSTVKYLLLKPGFLTYEYVRGKRMTYLHPIRMYVFTSAFFFLMFFSFISTHQEEKKGIEWTKQELAEKQEELSRLKEMKQGTEDDVLRSAVDRSIAKYDSEIALLADSVRKMEINAEKSEKDDDDNDANPGTTQPGIPADIANTIDSVTKAIKKDTGAHNVDSGRSLSHSSDAGYRYKQADSAKNNATGKEDTVTHNSGKKLSDDFLNFEFYQDEPTYLAIQKELPKERQDGVIKKAVKQKLLNWHDKQKKNNGKVFDNVKEKFKHSFPTLLFVSLPIFAFLLKLLYIRRKQFYYADHGIFTLHVYCATFILLLLYYLSDALKIKTGWWLFSFAKAVFVIYIMYYTYKAMRNFYGQKRLKTLFKYFFLGWMTSIVMFILILIFLILSAYKA